MREIILRAYEPRKKEWHYFHIPFDIGKTIPEMSPSLYYENWCESTGLNDKNGIKIFEGDVLKSSNSDPDYDIWDDVENTEIYWDDENACWAGSDWFIDTETKDESIYCPNFVEVIGNIYENPELLKELK